MNIRNPFNWNLRFGTIPSEFKEAMTYEEQVMWLYYQIKELKEGNANYNYNLLENKPSIDGVILQGNVTKSQLGIEQNYSILMNKPLINNIVLEGNKSLNELGIQGKLIAGSGIRISGNTISTTGGGTGGTSNYEELENLPSINGVELIGDKTGEQLNLQNSLSIDYSDKAIIRKYYDMTNIQVGDVIQTPLTFNTQGDRDCIVIPTTKGMKFNIYGKFQFLLTNSANIVTNIEDYITEPTTTTIEILSSGGMLIINFDNQLYTINQEMTSEYLQIMLEKQEGDYEIRKLTENIPLNPTLPIGTYLETGFYDTSIYVVTIEYQNGSFLIADSGSIFYFDSADQTFITPFMSVTFDNNDNQWYIKQNEQIENELTNNRNKIPTSQAVYQAIQNIEPSSDGFYTEIDSNVTLNADGTTTPELQSGYYFLKSPRSITYVKYGGTTETDYQFNDGIFFYDSENKILKRTGTNKELTNQLEYRLGYISSGQYWELEKTDDNDFVKNLTGTISFLSDTIPSTGSNNNVPNINAVRNYVGSQASSNFYTILESNVTLNTDGSSTPSLQTGYYFIPTGYRLDYYEESTGTLINDYKFENNIFYYNENTGKIYLNLLNNDLVTNYISYYLTYNSLENGWYVSHQNIDDYVYNGYASQSQVVNSIPNSGNNNDVANINAIRNYVDDKILDVYSSTEKRVGTWYNGKPLYEKTIETTQIPQVSTDGTQATTSISIDSQNVDFAFIVNSFALSSSDSVPTSVQTLPYISNAGYQLKTMIGRTGSAPNQYPNISVVSTGTAYNSYYKIYIVVRFTKSTD